MHTDSAVIVSNAPSKGSAPKTAATPSILNSAALNKSPAHFGRLTGPNLLARTEQYNRWRQIRQDANVWPYTRTLEGPIDTVVEVRNESGRHAEGLNFASQDYLSLSSHPSIIEAAIRALHDFGPHSAGSPMLLGNTAISLLLSSDLVRASATRPQPRPAPPTALC